MPGGLKLFHDKFARHIREHEEYAAEFDEAILHNEQMKNCLHKVGLLPHHRSQSMLILRQVYWFQYVPSYIFSTETLRECEWVTSSMWVQIGDDLNPIRVLALFSAINDEVCELLDLAGRPEHLIMTHLPVPPVCIRPSVEMDSGGGTNEDDITMKLMVRLNRVLASLAASHSQALCRKLVVQCDREALTKSTAVLPSIYSLVDSRCMCAGACRTS